MCLTMDDQTDPTLSNFMPTFDALDADAQALVILTLIR